jgi:uncharacterized protein YggE
MPIIRSGWRASSVLRRAMSTAAAGLAVALVSACGSADKGAAAASPRQVTVVGSGHVQGVPDTVTANVGISFTATDVTTAMNQTNSRQQAVINALVGAGVDRKNISTTKVSLRPEHANGTAAKIITGYRADNVIQLKIHPPDAASHLLALVVDTGGDATRITSVSYSIEDNSQLVKDARARAFQDAKARAEQYAQLSGLKLGKVLSISETSATPEPRAMPSNVPLEPGQQTVRFSVTAVWELR